ncbi:MAG: acetoacetate decarboxylase family protein [Solirubrobacteraceae bacterium]
MRLSSGPGLGSVIARRLAEAGRRVLTAAPASLRARLRGGEGSGRTKIPKRLARQAERYAQVDGIQFALPVSFDHTPGLMAIFAIDRRRAAELLPGNEVHPVRVFGDRALLVVTVANYEVTAVGPYVELSIAIACTHGERPAPALLPGLLRRRYGTGQFVLDRPVSSEIAVKGGKGIWGMPKHQANLDFVISKRKVSSQYDLDGQLAMRIEVDRPRFFARLPVTTAAVNYCAFRGMLMKSRAYISGRGGFNLPFTRSARLVIGDHPQLSPLKDLGIGKRPLIAGFLPDTAGTLDDHLESWFLSSSEPPATAPEGLESVVGLGQSQEWLSPPKRPRARRRRRLQRVAPR